MDLEPTPEQQELIDGAKQFLERECPPARVRTNAATGFDETVMQRARELDIPGLALAEDLGTLGLVIETFGQHCAPLPAVELMAAARALQRLDTAEARQVLKRLGDGEVIVAAFPSPAGYLTIFRENVSGVLVFDGDEVVLVEPASLQSMRSGVGETGLALVNPIGGQKIADDSRAMAASRRLHLEDRCLAACWLVGVGQAAVDDATTYAGIRQQFGVPIGCFQALAHMLANALLDVTAARWLALEAAWAGGVGDTRWELLTTMAFITAAAAAQQAAERDIHVHGGHGFVVDANAQAFYRRAKVMSALRGDSDSQLLEVGRLLNMEGYQ